MAVNRVDYAGQTLIDITDSTVTPETLSEGVVAYDASGNRIMGIMSGGDPLLQESHTVINNQNGNITKTLSDRTITTVFSKNGLDDVITETHVMNEGQFNYIKKTVIKKIDGNDDIKTTVDKVSK